MEDFILMHNLYVELEIASEVTGISIEELLKSKRYAVLNTEPDLKSIELIDNL